MQPEIQKLIDHPELLKATLKLDDLDQMIHSLLEGFDFEMQYKVEAQGRWQEPAFEAWSDTEMVPQSGIFKLTLVRCNLGTFGQKIAYDEAEGYRCWFSLHLSYMDYEGGMNGMKLGDFYLRNGAWEVKYTKATSSRIE